MQIILLSGGSGTRLWPLSNDNRSKQFLRILDNDRSSALESMIQRVHRQLREAGINDDITVATGVSQVDSVIAQLGSEINIVPEPSRRDTFPAISLACEYLSKQKKCKDDEVVIVMPCDPYTEIGYFEIIKKMAQGISEDKAEMIIMGISPTYPSSKYGYILPSNKKLTRDIVAVKCFTEKPSIKVAEKLIEDGAFWNGGVFAFRLGYVTSIARRYNSNSSFSEIKSHYNNYPKISFDYEVVEKTKNIGMVKFEGPWEDLGTWNTLTNVLRHNTYGNVTTDDSVCNTHIINELNIPILCIGTENLVVAASPDGILVAEKSKSESLKGYAEGMKSRPMYEERRWGTYRVIDYREFQDGYCVLTKQISLNPGCSISYQRHKYRDENWTFLDGQGILVIDGEQRMVGRGDTTHIPKGKLHALKALTTLSFIEVQSGTNLIEEDIERFDYNWITI